MTKTYIIGACVFGALFIGWAWLSQDEGVTSKNNAPAQAGVVYDQVPPAAKPPATGGGDSNF